MRYLSELVKDFLAISKNREKQPRTRHETLSWHSSLWLVYMRLQYMGPIFLTWILILVVRCCTVWRSMRSWGIVSASVSCEAKTSIFWGLRWLVAFLRLPTSQTLWMYGVFTYIHPHINYAAFVICWSKISDVFIYIVFSPFLRKKYNVLSFFVGFLVGPKDISPILGILHNVNPPRLALQDTTLRQATVTTTNFTVRVVFFSQRRRVFSPLVIQAVTFLGWWFVTLSRG